MKTDELDFHLPQEAIAQVPAAERASSRLLHYRRDNRSIAHRTFSDLPTLLRCGDLLVFNDTRVIPARFTLRKATGGLVEGLFLSQVEPRRWEVMLKNLGSFDDRTELTFSSDPSVSVRAIAKTADGHYSVEVTSDDSPTQLLGRLGRMPLPPYIKRERERDARDQLDRERYQTVIAQSEGSVAAPTAALHFTPELIDALDRAGVQRTSVTLDVGLGTFKPVTADRVEDHAMHVERYRISQQAAETLNQAKTERRRIVAVGTTAARVLESQPADRPFEAKEGETGILIFPPYTWKHVGALITNFHLPRSTLIALVAALVGLDEQRRIYQTAIEQRYRFFSYGDAMLIE